MAIVDRTRDQRHTYADLDASAELLGARARVASALQAGDRVASLTGNRVETIALFFGATRVGAVLVPLNWRLAAPELARVLADAQPARARGRGAAFGR